MNGRLIPILERTDVKAITPDNLYDRVDYSLLDKYAKFSHRGHVCDIERTISAIGVGFDHLAIEKPGNISEVEFHETEAVDVVVDGLKKLYPAWFGDQEALEAVEKPVSDLHLSKADLVETYFNNEIQVNPDPISASDWTDQKAVIMPIMAIALEKLEAQIRADKHTTIETSQQRIKRAIVEEAVKGGLTRGEIHEAVKDAEELLKNV